LKTWQPVSNKKFQIKNNPTIENKAVNFTEFQILRFSYWHGNGDPKKALFSSSTTSAEVKIPSQLTSVNSKGQFPFPKKTQFIIKTISLRVKEQS